MATIIEKVKGCVRATVGKYRMVRPGDLIVVAVSGGPDSMCLFDVLLQLREELGIGLHVGYLHHHMRAQADDDVRMVMGHCASYGVPVTVGHTDVLALAKSEGIGEEEAGRNARYRFLLSLKEHLGARRVALGHNQNDQAETVLMRLFRGSGTQGLAGIPPVTDKLIRPIIDVQRDDIEKYCRARDLPTITDVYNMDLQYTRNLVRHRVIPCLSKAFNPSLVRTLGESAMLLRWDSSYLEQAALTAFDQCTFLEGPVTFVDAKSLANLPPAISSRVLELAWRECSGTHGNLPVSHAERLTDLEPNETLSLPGGVLCTKDGGYLQMYPPPPSVNVPLVVPGVTDIPQLHLRIMADFVEPSQDVFCSSGKAPSRFLLQPEACLDYEKCEDQMTVRTRLRGDRFAPLGMDGKRQKLKDFFISNKVPRLYRDFVPLVISRGDVAWVGGLRLNHCFRVNEGTKQVLRLRVEPYLRRNQNCANI